ncbi:hypothetical protein PMI30_02111 [Pseudomonas sp. GM50]|uniref:hypothetical protein n=1 Tax=Pseudomonas sp. GM50 TaxID=1144332 RepID=UPI0002707097|nr:hypothetical protein [Pseudomonas sp. GM50]EJM67647.1 hypothetical protein PMI30_02111 [Pseudomonas sp. GM50]
MNKAPFACLALAMIFHAGCTTHLQSRQDGYGPYTHAPDKTFIEMGGGYGLPMLQFKISVRRTLLQCTNEAGTPDIRFLTKVEADPSYIVGERISVDSEKMAGWSKVSRLSLETYDSGVIKSLNAAAEDQTKAIAGSVVKSGFSLLSLVSGVPLVNLSEEPREGPPEPPSTYVCSATTLSALKEIQAETGNLEAQTEQLVILTDEVARMERLAGLGGLSQALKNQLDKVQKEASVQSKRVAKADQSLARLIKRVSITEEIIWPRTYKQTELNEAPSAHSKAALLALFQRRPVANGYSDAQLSATLNLKGRLVPVVKTADAVPCSDTQLCDHKAVDADDGEGLLYRDPVAARLLICEVSDLRNCNVDGATGVVVSSIVMVPQLGKLRMLTFRNGVFQNNELKVVFRENGGIATISYDEKAARGQQLAETVSAGLDQAVAYRDARQAHELKQLTDTKAQVQAQRQSELDELDARIAVLQKTRQINELSVQSSQDTSLSDVKAETARLNAHIALLEAQRQVREGEQALANARES